MGAGISTVKYPPPAGSQAVRPWLNPPRGHRQHVATSHPQLWFCTALLFPALPKIHSDAEGGPSNLPQSLVVMLAMLNLLNPFVQQYIIICSHPRPLQHTSPQYVGLDVRLTNMLQTRSSTLMKRLRSCAVPSAELPAKLAFVPYPWAPSRQMIATRRGRCSVGPFTSDFAHLSPSFTTLLRRNCYQ